MYACDCNIALVSCLTTRDGEVASWRRVPTFGNSKTNRTGEEANGKSV